MQRKELENVPTVGDYRKLVNRAMKEGDYKGACALAIVFYTGVRVSELIKLKKRDFEDGGQPKDFLEVAEGKGDKRRIIALPLKRATPHKMRHLYGLTVLKGCKNIETVRQMLGHSSINTTAIYLNQSKEAQYDEVAKAFNDY